MNLHIYVGFIAYITSQKHTIFKCQGNNLDK